MSINRIPTTQCVHIFSSELERLIDRLDTPIEDTPSSYLYGLWTHTSNIVIHLIVSDQEELKHAKAHRLNCVGYVANEYTRNMAHEAELSPNRQHVIVDVNETKTSHSLRAYSSHRDVFRGRENPLSPERLLQVNVLKSESPFRKELREKNPGVEQALNEYKNESGNGLASSSYDVFRRSTQDALNPAHILTVANENHYCKIEMRDMNGEHEINDESPCPENQLNGHQYETETDLSWKKQMVIHKIKNEFQLDDKDIQVEETLKFKFEHCDKQWQIQLTDDHTTGKQYAQIFFQECNAFSQEIASTQDVIDKIKELCHCPVCKEKLQNSTKNDQQ